MNLISACSVVISHEIQQLILWSIEFVQPENLSAQINRLGNYLLRSLGLGFRNAPLGTNAKLRCVNTALGPVQE